MAKFDYGDDRPAQPDVAETSAYQHHLRSRRAHPLLAALAGAAAAVATGVAAGFIAYKFGYSLGFISIGIGYLVGYAVRAVARSPNPNYGFMAAALAVVATGLGNVLPSVLLLTVDKGLPVSAVDPRMIADYLVDTFSLWAGISYGLAAYFGYRSGFYNR